ncbi:MAG: 3-methyl-2-oxobutanoate hydroxymethyltransferase [Actinobacteria bacterium]|nr:3-methyl-2-oxobutanoate hydroxymethyltransferase [Actinomycetota bacterium]
MQQANKVEKKLTIHDLKSMKAEGEKISATTAFDFNMACIAEEAGIELIVTGAAMMVMAGRKNTLSAEMHDTIFHLKLIQNGIKRAVVQCGLPFGSYQVSNEKAVENAVKLIKEGADSVKLEGAGIIADRVNAIHSAGIPVASHLGMTPHYLSKIGGFRSVGRTAKEAVEIYNDAKLLQDAGAWSIELECVPFKVAEVISRKLNLVTIGIGSGAGCDAQLLISHDIIGMQKALKTKFAKKYADVWKISVDAIIQYRQEVKQKNFPTEQYSFSIEEDQFQKFLDIIG